jgi:hypothetical protein
MNMKTLLLLSVVVGIAVFVVSVRGSTTSPKDVMERFVKMDIEGARLTPQGWHEADALFVKPSEPSQPKVLVVIARHYAVSEGTAKGNTGEFYMGYEEVGRINTSSLYFMPSSSGIEMRSFDKYTLVLTNAYRTPAVDKDSTKGIQAPVEWRIDGVQPVAMHLTADAAMRYVTRIRAETSDRAIQKNADTSLTKLSGFR